MHPYILHNDQIARSTEPLLHPGQLGLLSGWGVFTTLRIYDGIPFAFERHWQRLSRDAQLLHVPFPPKPERIHAWLIRLIEANDAKEAALRLCVVRNDGGFWAGPGTGDSFDVIAMTNSVQHWKDSFSLSVVANTRFAASPFSGTKSLSWAHNLTLVETAKDNGFDEVILLNERGEVTECTSANLFATKEGVTHTPPISSGSSPGVTRAVMLEELDIAQTPIVETVLRLEDLYAADEVFITSTSRELLPVHSIQNQELKGGPSGWPVVRRLREALRAYIQGYTLEQKNVASQTSTQLLLTPCQPRRIGQDGARTSGSNA
jgi:branched-chain amino acid aminotransferase